MSYLDNAVVAIHPPVFEGLELTLVEIVFTPEGYNVVPGGLGTAVTVAVTPYPLPLAQISPAMRLLEQERVLLQQIRDMAQAALLNYPSALRLEDLRTWAWPYFLQYNLETQGITLFRELGHLQESCADQVEEYLMHGPPLEDEEEEELFLEEQDEH